MTASRCSALPAHTFRRPRARKGDRRLVNQARAVRRAGSRAGYCYRLSLSFAVARDPRCRSAEPRSDLLDGLHLIAHDRQRGIGIEGQGLCVFRGGETVCP